MKKKFISLLASLIMVFGTGIFLPTSDVSYATQSRYYNFNVDVSITGNGAVDMVNLAKSMVGKNGAYFGYTEEWCADFVSDCAYLVNQSSAIPADGYCPNLQTKIKNAGGYYVEAKNAQPGDILFYGTNGGAHVEIVYANNNGVLSTIGGNSGDANNSKSLVKDHKNQSGQPSVYKAMRPNYKGITPEPNKPAPDPNWNSYLPIKSYTLGTGTTYVYNSDCKTFSGGEIWKDDECTIRQVYKNGWCQVEYPVGSGTRTAYTPLSTFMMENSLYYHGEAKKEIPTYRRVDMSEAYGSVSAGDMCYFTGFAGDKTQVLYPLDSGGYKFGFIKYKFTAPDSPWYSGLTPENLGNDFYANIIVPEWNKCLTNDGDMTTFRNKTSKSNQIWKFIRNSDGSYRIKSMSDNKSLDVRGDKSDSETRVGVWSDNDSHAQRWNIYKVNDNYYFKPFCSDCVLDLRGGKGEEGSEAEIYEKHDGPAQKFSIKELKQSTDLSYKVGNSAEKTTFTWNSLEIADHYDIKIWNGTYWDGDYYWSAWHEKGTSKEVVLPAGHYEGYVDSVTPDGSVYMSNVIKFDIKAATLNVTFNANGGSVSTTSKTVTHNSTYGSLPTSTRTGYTFKGWYTAASGGSKVDANTKVTVTSNQTLYAQWTAKSVSVKFFRNHDVNDTSSATETFTYGVSNQKFGYKTDGTGRYSPMNSGNIGFGAWSRTGYEMLGWSADRNATSIQHSTYSGVSDNWIDSKSPSINLYAIWRANNYTIAYNSNGGSGTTANSTMTYDKAANLNANGFSRTGYTFKGWNTKADGSGTAYADKTSVKNLAASGTVTLYAQWVANSYTIAYNSNGGSGTIANSTMTYDKAANLNANGFSRTGYTFKGWNTKADGSGTAYADKTSVKNLAASGTVTLYAQWTAKTVSVKLFRNHDGNDTSNVTEIFTYDVSNQKFGYKTDGTGRYSKMNAANVGFGEWSKTGYELLGWSFDKNATSAQYSTYSGVSNDWINKYSSSANLYAVWKAKQYTVTFDANSGNVSPISKTVTYNSTYGDLPTPTRAGYTFNGWYTEKTGGTKITSDTKLTIASDNTLYAQWKAVKGDANNDSTVNIADAVMLQKWLLGSGSLTNWENADLCKDGRIDVFDMIEMRKLLIQNK